MIPTSATVRNSSQEKHLAGYLFPVPLDSGLGGLLQEREGVHVRVHALQVPLPVRFRRADVPATDVNLTVGSTSFGTRCGVSLAMRSLRCLRNLLKSTDLTDYQVDVDKQNKADRLLNYPPV